MTPEDHRHEPEQAWTIADPAWFGAAGTTALEFALVAPLLVLLVVATVEFGYALTVQNLLELAARKASRTGVTGSRRPA